LASQTKEGDGGECGEKAEVERGAVQVLALYVHVVSSESEVGVPTGGGEGCWGEVEDALAPKIGDGRSRERAYARSMFLGLVTRARRGGRVKESQKWGWRRFACADCMATSSVSDSSFRLNLHADSIQTEPECAD
jgi:hypothetical protein